MITRLGTSSKDWIGSAWGLVVVEGGLNGGERQNTTEVASERRE